MIVIIIIITNNKNFTRDVSTSEKIGLHTIGDTGVTGRGR